MRELSLNGYIDDEMWFGDEITPESLHEALYGKEKQLADDVHIRLNSYGGSCNAAVRMFDDVRAYPGSVWITFSGTAASAATVLAMAADRLEMTPGSLWMIHDPSVVAWGNERELMDSIRLLQACKESILNVYQRRCRQSRQEVAAMMSATAWLDAQSALQYGFIDAISENGKPGAPENAGRIWISPRRRCRHGRIAISPGCPAPRSRRLRTRFSLRRRCLTTNRRPYTATLTIWRKNLPILPRRNPPAFP